MLLNFNKIGSLKDRNGRKKLMFDISRRDRSWGGGGEILEINLNKFVQRKL